MSKIYHPTQKWHSCYPIKYINWTFLVSWKKTEIMESKKYQRLDENKDFLSTESIEFKESASQKQSKCCRKAAVIAGLVLVFTAVATLSVFYILFPSIARHSDDSDALQYEVPVKGLDNVMQHVQSSVRQNYVQYYIQVSPNEKTWILDDFNTDLEVIKSVRDNHAICFVSKFNRSLTMQPTDVQPELSPYKSHNHGVYTPDEIPTEDHSFLGPKSRALCEDANLYWMRPMEVTEVENAPLNYTSSLPVGYSGNGRSKRNIAHCSTSCCWMVCCCTTHQFTWQSSERFTCAHVCDKCTKAYKHEIREICWDHMTDFILITSLRWRLKR